MSTFVNKKAIDHGDRLALLGNNVKKLRRDAGLSQEELAECCGIYRTYLSRIESGIANPTVTVLMTLAVCLGVSLRDIFGE